MNPRSWKRFEVNRSKDSRGRIHDHVTGTENAGNNSEIFFVVSLVMAHHVLLNQPQVNSLYAHDPTIAKVMLR